MATKVNLDTTYKCPETLHDVFGVQINPSNMETRLMIILQLIR